MCILICSVRWNNVTYPPHQYPTELRGRHKFYCYPRHSSQGFSFLWPCSVLPIFQSPMVTLPAQVTNETSSISDARVVRSLQLQSCGSNSAAGIFLAFSSTAIPKESIHCKRNGPMNPNGSTSSIRISAPVSAPSQNPGFTSLSNNF